MSKHHVGNYALTRTIESMSPRLRPHEALTRLCDGALHGALGRPRETRPDPELDGTLQQAYVRDISAHDPGADILGPVYMELASHGGRKFMGQFFTPRNVADLMAGIALMNLPSALPSDQPLRLCEPTAGSGVMLLAGLMHILETRGPEWISRLSLTAIDLDRLCALMTATQILVTLQSTRTTLAHIGIYHGNSLGDPRHLEPILVASAPREILAHQHQPSAL
jgi:type I restriction-modification system DNA methylase subunit